jgi:hypothetical protein
VRGLDYWGIESISFGVMVSKLSPFLDLLRQDQRDIQD